MPLSWPGEKYIVANVISFGDARLVSLASHVLTPEIPRAGTVGSLIEGIATCVVSGNIRLESGPGAAPPVTHVFLSSRCQRESLDICECLLSAIESHEREQSIAVGILLTIGLTSLALAVKRWRDARFWALIVIFGLAMGASSAPRTSPLLSDRQAFGRHPGMERAKGKTDRLCVLLCKSLMPVVV